MPCTLFFFKAKHLELFFKIYGWLRFPSSIPENVDRENQIILIPTSKISTMLYQNRDTTFLKGHSLFVCSEVRNPTSCKTFQTLQLHNQYNFCGESGAVTETVTFIFHLAKVYL